MDLEDFALAIEDLSAKIYGESEIKIAEEERKYYLLIDKIYYSLSSF